MVSKVVGPPVGVISTQRLQNTLMKEFTLNLIGVPTISLGIFLNEGVLESLGSSNYSYRIEKPALLSPMIHPVTPHEPRPQSQTVTHITPLQEYPP